MSQRTAKFVFAIFVSLLASGPLATASHGAPAEADKCLSGPKGPVPAGGHWYYRLERGTKRQCWYIGEAKDKSVRAAQETSAPVANSTPAPDNSATQSSIANARAEFSLPQSRAEQVPSIFTAPRMAPTITGKISPENDQRANAVDTDAQSSVVATRWPELADVSAQSAPAPYAENSAAVAPTNSRAISKPASKATPPAGVAALPLATANTPFSDDSSRSVQMLLITIVGALALAGLLASAIIRFGSRRRTTIRIERRVNWDAARTDRPPLSDEARYVRPVRELDVPRQPREANVPNEQVEQMLARLARSAAS